MHLFLTVGYWLTLLISRSSFPFLHIGPQRIISINKPLKIIGISKNSGGFLINATDSITHDTLRLMSRFKSKKQHECKQEVKLNQVFHFVYHETSVLGPMNNLTIGMGSKKRGDFTVIWKTGDPYKELPFSVENLDGLCILN